MFEVSEEVSHEAAKVATNFINIIEAGEYSTPSVVIALLTLLVGGAVAGGSDKDSFLEDISRFWNKISAQEVLKNDDV